METPYAGRATVNDYGIAVEIVIPARRIYFFMIFFGVWITAWIFGGLIVMATVLLNNPAGWPLIIVWALMTTVVLATIGRFVWWMAFGKEVIRVEPGILTITKKGAWFIKPKMYNLEDAKSFRAQEDYISYQKAFSFRGSNLLNNINTGTIRFDYGMQTVKFAGNIDEAEAKYLLDVLKSKKLLNESNF